LRVLSALVMSSLAALSAVRPALAMDRQVLPGPVPAVVERVVDGDTLEVRAQIWIGQEVRVLIRLSDIDTPELKGRCQEERQLAHQARRFVVHEIAGGPILLTNIRLGKYAGRVIADIKTAAGANLGARLLDAGLAKPYRKGRYRHWCCPDRRCAGDRLSLAPARRAD